MNVLSKLISSSSSSPSSSSIITRSGTIAFLSSSFRNFSSYRSLDRTKMNLQKMFEYFLSQFPPSLSTVLKLLGLLMILVNLKSLPLMWHGRFYHALYKHLLKNRTNYPTPSHLFAPISTVSRPTLYECDVNMHKSNSSYFSDLDINRSHLVAHLIKKSLQTRRKKGERAMYVALAGVTSLFRREIKPFEKYEMRSRVIAWDGKWLFVVSHFVKLGKVTKNNGSEEVTKRIYASCLSKYVFKQGKKTVPPEEVLSESGLIPPRPEGVPPPDYSTSNSPGSSSGQGTNTPVTGELSSSTVLVPPGGSSSITRRPSSHGPNNSLNESYENVVDRVLEKSLEVNSKEGNEWTYSRIERERKRGMEIARFMLGLDALDGEIREVESWGKLW